MKKLNINKNEFGYFIDMNNDEWRDIYVAEELNILFNDYIEILKNNNAHLEDEEYYFENIQDVEKAIEVLESYLIMKKLTE